MGVKIHKKPTEPAIPHGTYYWSAPGAEFIPYNPDTDAVHYDGSGIATTDGNGITWICAVHLPQGAVITSAVVNGVAAGETWALKRNTHAGTEDANMGTGNFNAADTVIASATVENNLKVIYFRTSTLDATDTITSAAIIYTL